MIYKLLSYSFLLVCLTSCSEKKSHTDDVLITEKNSKVSNQEHELNHSEINVSPIKKISKFTPKGYSSTYKFLKPEHTGDKIKLTFLSEGALVKDIEILNGEGLEVYDSALNFKVSGESAKNYEPWYGVILAVREKIMAEGLVKDYVIRGDTYIINYNDINDVNYTAILDMSIVGKGDNEVTIAGKKSAWQKIGKKGDVLSKEVTEKATMHSILLSDINIYGGIAHMEYTLGHPTVEKKFLKTIPERIIGYNKEIPIIAGYKKDLKVEVPKLGGDLAIFFADDFRISESIYSRVILRKLKGSPISLSEENTVFLKTVNVTFKLPDNLTEYSAVVYLNNIDDSVKNFEIGFLNVIKGKRETGKFSAGQYFLKTKKGFKPVNLVEGAIIEIEADD
jgi:hypothetical protein